MQTLVADRAPEHGYVQSVQFVLNELNEARQYTVSTSAPGASVPEQLARLAEGEGFSRIGSRMLAALTLAATPRSIDELARALKVSRASISTNGKLLRSLGFVERVTRPGDRRDYLQVSGDATTVVIALGLRRLTVMRAVIHTVGIAARRRPSERARIRRIEALYDNLIMRLQLERAR